MYKYVWGGAGVKESENRKNAQTNIKKQQRTRNNQKWKLFGFIYLQSRSLKYKFPPRVHMVSSIRVFENGDFFRLSPPHVNDVFGDQKRKFSKKVPACSFFKALFCVDEPR